VRAYGQINEAFDNILKILQFKDKRLHVGELYCVSASVAMTYMNFQ
jgi:hypothetical protein